MNHVFTAEELLPKAIEMAENMCGCVPHVLKQYKPLIDEGYSMPLNEAMPWEEAKAIESAKQASAAMIEARRKKVLEKGRSESE